MSTQARSSIRARLMRMNLVIVIVSIALSIGGTLYFTLRSEQTALDNNLLNSASILSRVPMIQEALQGERTIEELSDYLDETTSRTSDIDLIIVGGKDFDLTDVLCIAEELHCALGKPVDVYELREINPRSTFYDAILSEGVQIA